MKSIVNHLVLVLASMTAILNVIHGQPYVPTEKIFLNCGSIGETTDSYNRNWTTDKGLKYVPKEGNTIAATAYAQGPSVPTVPYMTARIFDTEFTYSFLVVPGRKAIRLHFYPASYGNRSASGAIFDVTSGKFTLMRNFNALQTVQASRSLSMCSEYYVHVGEGNLNITFTPSANASNSYAFVNGIEIVAMPDIYNTMGEDAMIIGQRQPFIIDNSRNLECLYRVNVGGDTLSPNNDTGMFRLWSDDSSYISGLYYYVDTTNLTIKYYTGIPPYVAPTDIYATARVMSMDANFNMDHNLSWIFPVDPGFFYLVRLHFCEVEPSITKPNQRMFKIFINNQTAEDQADVVLWTGGNGIGTYRDYVVLIPRSTDRQGLWLQLASNTETKSMYYDAILNGVEIFKISDTSGNLAGIGNTINPPSIARRGPKHTSKHIGVIATSAVGGLSAAGLLFALIVVWRCRGGKESNATGQSYRYSLASDLSRHFSFSEIKLATNNFDDALILGVGGFGKVYKGEVDGGSTKVAIKRGNPLSNQGIQEFQTEIEMLSKLRHRHLVSLIGYCEENSEMILVYDYMAHGTLRKHLYNTQKPPLSWNQRLAICIGAARGLHYLHTGAKHSIIHRDVKTTNILLDENWVAKVSDFGLSKSGPGLDNAHVSTVVKGSFGYLDPEYFRRQQLSLKSDVYSFGVVLFEVLCARPALITSIAREKINLVEWALHCQKEGSLAYNIDPYLEGKITPECFKKFTETAEKCVADNGTERPTMGDVLWNLELAMQLQKSAEENGDFKVKRTDESPFYKKNMGNKDSDSLCDEHVTDLRSSGLNKSIGGLASEDSEGLTPSHIFSQITYVTGR